MAGFERIDGVLACDGWPLDEMAAAEGTPLHVYSEAAIVDRVARFRAAFREVMPAVHYAVKANSTGAIVRLMRREGLGADVNSPGELEVALRAGYQPADIVCTGVGKTDDELRRAIGLGVRAINVESAGECRRIAGIAR